MIYEVVIHLQYEKHPSLLTHTLGDISDLVVWGQVEAAVAIVAACLPTIRALLHRDFLHSSVDKFRSLLWRRSPNHTQLESERIESGCEALASDASGIFMGPVRGHQSDSHHHPATTEGIRATTGLSFESTDHGLSAKSDKETKWPPV